MAQITKNFTMEEMISSGTARRHGISNEPTASVEKCLIDLCEKILQPLRDAYGKPIIVNAGYRSPAVNKALAADYKRQGKKIYVAPNSQHMYGQAADITGGSPARNKELFDLAVKLKLPFDQLIDEYGYRWIHVSYGPRNRRQQLHLK